MFKGKSAKMAKVPCRGPSWHGPGGVVATEGEMWWWGAGAGVMMEWGERERRWRSRGGEGGRGEGGREDILSNHIGVLQVATKPPYKLTYLVRRAPGRHQDAEGRGQDAGKLARPEKDQ